MCLVICIPVCCSSKGSLIVLLEGIHEGIYTTWSPSWLEIKLVLLIHRAGITPDVAASFPSSKCLVSQQYLMLSPLSLPRALTLNECCGKRGCFLRVTWFLIEVKYIGFGCCYDLCVRVLPHKLKFQRSLACHLDLISRPLRIFCLL
jgi:hypothetical protein